MRFLRKISSIHLGSAMLAMWMFIHVGCTGNSERRLEVSQSANGETIWNSAPSSQCLECHADIAQAWKVSDHANANRLFDLDQWKSAFSPTQYFTEGGDVSRFLIEDSGKKAVVETVGTNNKPETYHPEMVLAHRPLVQFLIPQSGGRWQCTELAWDVSEEQWFHVNGLEHRKPGEWGHWTGRGMNWNAQCAICHTSFYEKNYDPASDTYASKWMEMGVNCQQCHGEMIHHIKNPEAALLDSEIIGDESYFESCVSCHSRREDLTGTFRVGEFFTDHHRLQLPVNDRLYYPDGQNRDEVFVYGSFLMSKMHQSGVRCMDCHDPHSLTLKLPIENNALCLRCHQSPGLDGATVIDPIAHSHHQDGSEGNLCVQCHMPERMYMQRDPRRDHGFHTPDPFLSESLGVPNACLNCHDKEGEGETWVKAAFTDWYGDSENLLEKRRHAHVVQKGYERDPDVKTDMLNLLKVEPSAIWRAAFIQMLLEMNPNEAEFADLMDFGDDPSPIVRDAVVQSLSNEPGFEAILSPLLKDESRLVRLDASWYLRDQLVLGSELEKELQHYMNYASDQPGGALRKAHFYAENGNKLESLKWIDRVVSWDSTSADAWINRGLILHRFDETEEAIASFENAHKLAPSSLIPLTYIAMLVGETGDFSAVVASWERVLDVDPNYGRAWYNIGLLMAQNGNVESAISYLEQGAAVSPNDPDIPYAKATLLYQNGDLLKAKATLLALLESHPGYQPAIRMMMLLQ